MPEPLPPSLLLDYDGTFFRGAKSDGDPAQLPLGYYWWGINVLNVGGTVGCRPGYRCIVSFPPGNLQGAAIFRPKVGVEQMVACIEGVVYVSPFPFTDWHQLPNVLFSPTAKQIFWSLTTQTARRITNDFASAIEVISPKAVLMMQDGGSTAPAWYDGSNSGHIRDHSFETPSGGPMIWVGDRLWVAKGNLVFASDIGNPFSFREEVYLGGIQGFAFSGDVTALAKTPSIEVPQLAVFTKDNVSVLQANIRNRDQWPLTDNFQVEILQTGCVGQRAIVSHYARLTWVSPSGIVVFDFATAGKLSVRLPVRDNEMMFSKNVVSEDLSLVAGAAFGQYSLMSVPAEDVYNKHTWVLNDASLETLSDDSGPSWSGVWLGTRPVEWVYGDIAGSEKIYHVSKDEDGENRLWECFRPERLDNQCPIMWAVFTRGYFGPTGQTKKNPGQDCLMKYADAALGGIEDDLDFGVFFAGGTRGAFKQILGKRISVERGSLRADQNITATTDIFAYKAQSRKERTQDAQQQGETTDTGTCGVESPNDENRDDSFQLLIVGHGPGTIKWIRAWSFASPEDQSGAPDACKTEDRFNVIRFDGAGVHASDMSEAALELANRVVQRYTSIKTETLTEGGVSAVGVGMSESIVSQEAADRVASTIAIKQAESEILRVLPSVVSIGEGFE